MNGVMMMMLMMTMMTVMRMLMMMMMLFRMMTAMAMMVMMIMMVSRCPAFERSAPVGLGPRTRHPMTTLFGDTQLYKAFTWNTEDRRLIKAVKGKVQSLLAVSTNLHKTAVEWGEVKFLVDGVYIPFKKPSSYSTAYAWWYRTVAQPLKVTAGQFRPVEASGLPSSSTGQQPPSPDEASSQPSSSTVPHEASSRVLLRIASRIPAGSFPGIPSLKLLRGAHIRHFCVGLRGSDRTSSSEARTQLWNPDERKRHPQHTTFYMRSCRFDSFTLSVVCGHRVWQHCVI